MTRVPTTTRRTVLAAVAASTLPGAAIPAVAAPTGADPFLAAADAYAAACAPWNRKGLGDDEINALVDAIDPLEEALCSTPITSPAAALRAMDIFNTPRCALRDDNEERLVDAVHAFLRTLAGRSA